MRKILVLIFAIAVVFVNAQEKRVLTLDECIQSALDRNLTIKRSQNDLQAANSNKRQAYYNFLPNLNATLDYSIFEGSSIDNDGQVVTNNSNQSTPGISSNLTLFNAFANHHLLNRRKHEYNSSKYQLDDAKIAITAQVLRSYLNVLIDVENLRISTERLALLEGQFDREQKRTSVGVGSLEAVYNFQSQVATEKLNNVTLENRYRSDLLTLLQVIQMNNVADNFNSIEVEQISFQEDSDLLAFDEFQVVLDEILANSFNLKGSNELQMAAKASVRQSVSARYPTVSVFGSHYRNFSSTSSIDYMQQIKNTPTNFAQATVSIPIFNRYQVQNSIDNAKVGLLNSQLAYDQALLDVTNAAQSDYLDLRAAQIQYTTAVENFDALNQTFEFSKKRFDTGNTDFYTYLQALNNKNRAEAQLINAKYTIVLRKRILDLYRNPSQ